LAGTEVVFETWLSKSEHSWLYDHGVGGRAIMPGTGLAELLRAAAEQHFDGERVEVLSLVVQAPLRLPEVGAKRVQVVIRDEGGRFEATVYGRDGEGGAGEWVVHGSGELRRADALRDSYLDLEAIRQRCGVAVDVEAAYKAFSAMDMDYGPAFQGLRSVWRGENEALAHLRLPETVEGVEAYGVHPALLDAAIQAIWADMAIRLQAEGPEATQGKLYLLFAMDRVRKAKATVSPPTSY
jgi:acyl transferase domain-containing protein